MINGSPLVNHENGDPGDRRHPLPICGTAQLPAKLVSQEDDEKLMVWDADEIIKLTRKEGSLIKRSRSQNFNDEAAVEFTSCALPLPMLAQFKQESHHERVKRTSEALKADEPNENCALENTPSSFHFKMQKMNPANGPVMSPPHF